MIHAHIYIYACTHGTCMHTYMHIYICIPSTSGVEDLTNNDMVNGQRLGKKEWPQGKGQQWGVTCKTGFLGLLALSAQDNHSHTELAVSKHAPDGKHRTAGKSLRSNMSQVKWKSYTPRILDSWVEILLIETNWVLPPNPPNLMGGLCIDSWK